MSKFSFETARNTPVIPSKIVQRKYKSYSIDDAIDFDINRGIVVGVTNLFLHVPFLETLLKKKSFVSFLQGFQDNSVILIDVSNYKVIHDDKKISLNLNLKMDIDETKLYYKNYGGILNESGEHIINLKGPIIGPHFGVNLLLGDRSKFNEPLLTTPKSVVDQFGSGSFRGPAANQVLATSWGMLPQENGSPFNRQFYLVENGKQIFYSHNVNDNVKEAYCTHKVNSSIITYVTYDGLKITRTIYLKSQVAKKEAIALERQVVRIENLTDKKREITITFTGMFGSPNPGCQMVDVIYQTVINQSEIVKKGNKPIAIIPDYYPQYAREYTRFFSLGEDGFDTFSYNCSSFIGSGTIEYPENLLFLGNSQSVKGPSFFAVSKIIDIDKNSYQEVITSTGLVPGAKEADIQNAIILSFDADYKNELAEKEENFKNYASFLQVKTSDKFFNNYVNKNLPFQVLYQTYVSRAFAQTQKGYREIGFREIQDLYASMYYFVNSNQSELVKSLLAKWIVNVYEMGYANHNFFFVGKEPGMCSDDQLWLVEAIFRYVSLTSDYSFLDEKFLVAGKKKKRSLWETLKAIITYSSQISVGKHYIPLLDKADWNDCLKIDDDCLDGPTKEKLYLKQLRRKSQQYGERFESDLSESVMNGFLLVISLDEMIEMAKVRNENSYQDDLIKIKDRLVKSLKDNAYINGYYARVLINRESKYHFVGAPQDGLSLLDDFDGSIYLNSLSWSVLSGVASEEEISSMLKLADKYLKTKAGYVLCTPHDLTLCGSKEAATEQYFLGDRENGGVFKHATMMFAVAMIRGSKRVKNEKLKKQMLEDADYMINIVLPYHVMKDPYKFKGNPRLCTQYVNSITEEHIGPVLSGTATWLLLAILERQKN